MFGAIPGPPLQTFPKSVCQPKMSNSPALLLPSLLLLLLFPPPSLGYELSSVLDNQIIGTPKVVCEESEVALDILTAKPFIGNIFVKGRAKDASCRQSFGDPGKNETSVYTLSLGKCGMQRLRSTNPRGISFAVTVVVSFHPAGFITRNDRAYHLSCFYTEPEEIVTSSFEVSHLPAQELSDQMSLPSCRYTVHSGTLDGPQLSWANVGDTVYHVWECKGPELGILVKKCFVTDGDGEDHAVLDEEGCSLDLGLLGEVVYTGEGPMRAHAKSQVFKYADSNQLFFTCQIRMCQKQMDLCRGITPPKCSEPKKENEKKQKKGKGKGKEEAGKLDKLLDQLEVEVEGADWSLDEPREEQRPANGSGGRRAEEEEGRGEAAGNSTSGGIAEKEEEEEGGEAGGRGRRALPRQTGPGHGQLEVDVASPQMLVLDREDQARIGQSEAAVLLKATVPARRAGGEQPAEMAKKRDWRQIVPDQLICLPRAQLLLGLPLSMAFLALFGFLLSLGMGRILLKWKGRRGGGGRLGKGQGKGGWPA